MRPLRTATAIVVMLSVLGACSSAGHTSAAEVRADVPRTPANLSDARQAAASVNLFGLDLLTRDLGTAKGNVALSPWSIATVLAMVRAGARGETATEMDHVLHDADPAGLDEAMNGLGQQLASRNGTFPGSNGPEIVELSAGNRLFAQAGLGFAQPFLDDLASNYGADVGLVDFQTATEAARRAINSWVSDQTRQRIPQLLPPGILDTLTRLVLVNAVYLRADWDVPFAKDQTAVATFHAPGGDVSVPFMNGTTERMYASGDGWQAVELNYAGDQLAMTILLPDPGRYDQVVSSLSESVLATLDAAQTTDVDLSLPKFTIAHALDLGQQLSALGMPTAFTDQADFSGMTTQEPLHIQDVVHQANITVDEKGTVAAAATAAIITASAAPAFIRTVVVDRPFVFLIRDQSTGAILFAGQVTNPANH